MLVRLIPKENSSMLKVVGQDGKVLAWLDSAKLTPSEIEEAANAAAAAAGETRKKRRLQGRKR
jgi:hypothetical protein